MQQFSKMDNENQTPGQADSLYKSEIFNIIKKDGWEFDNNNCDYVIALVYLSNHMELIFRLEPIPPYKVREPEFDRFLTVLSGTRKYEENVEDCLFREIFEETGIVIHKNYTDHRLIYSTFISKGTTSKYYIYWVPLLDTEFRLEPAPGDGSDGEKNSTSFRLNVSQLHTLKPVDTITALAIQIAKNELLLR